MIADCLTKQTNLTGQMLLNITRMGTYSVPGGTTLRDSTLTSVKTWDQLMSAEQNLKKTEQAPMSKSPPMPFEDQETPLPVSVTSPTNKRTADSAELSSV